MNLDLTDDQEALRGAAREFFDKESPPEVVRAAEPLGFDAAVWRKAVGLGLAAIAVPEDRGGGGAGFAELAIAAELPGRSLAPVPLIEAAVATTLLASAPGGAAPEPLASAAVAGELLATTALHPVAGDVARLVPAGGMFERGFRAAQVTTIYGGASEVLRDIIAERHLGLPRSRPGL